MSQHERPTGIFSDIHAEEGQVRATLLHDPTIEGLDMAIYVDGSGSMSEEYEYKKDFQFNKKGGLLALAHGHPRPAATQSGGAPRCIGCSNTWPPRIATVCCEWLTGPADPAPKSK